MRTPKGKNYCSDLTQLNQDISEIKLLPCPHCRSIGFLICHGFLRGYAEFEQDQVIRGRRFFCSNRYRKKGCGGTYSVMLASVMRGFTVRVQTLWSFLKRVSLGLNRKAAWQQVQKGFSIQSGYRLWHRFNQAQTQMRTLLCRHGPPPDCDSEQPFIQLIQHFSSVFISNTCPFESFQMQFQCPLLP